MKKFKPLNLLNNKSFWPEKAAIVDAIKEILTLGECRRPLPVRDYGEYRDPHWRDEDGALAPYKSVDWYIYDALDEDRLQVDANALLQSLAEEPWRREDMLGDHYDLFVMEEDLFDAAQKNGGGDYIVGKALRFQAAVVSTHRIEHIWGMPYSYLKTEIMRQLCFMFDVPDVTRDDVALRPEAVACTNRCILRTGHDAPEDWGLLTEDRIRCGPLCENCVEDLRGFFRSATAEQGEVAP
jgi:hypothetical protein